MTDTHTTTSWGGGIAVEQCDREAAAEILGMYESMGNRQRTLDGSLDMHPVVEAFAKHRRQAHPTRNPSRETGWLIEEQFGSDTHWIALSDGSQGWTNLADFDDQILIKNDSPFRRTKDSNEALRFARKADAEAMIAKFDIHLLHPVATEHMWSDFQ